MPSPQPKVVFVSPYGHHGAVSGARKRVESLCNALADLGVDTACLSPWVPEAATQHIPYSLEGGVLKKLYAQLRLGVLLRDLKPNLVINESPIVPFIIGNWTLLQMIHDAKFVTDHARRGSGIVRRLHWISARVADGVLTVSNSEKNRISKALGIAESRIAVSWNGISDKWMAPLQRDSGSEQFNLLYVSNFAPHKGRRALLKALRHTGLSIAFVGADYGEMTACQDLASKWGVRAKFFGGLTENELITLYDTCGAFVFPSFLEGFGMPYLEARSRGLPVIANEIPVFRELQAHLGGTIVDFSSPEDVQQDLYRVLLEQRVQPDLQQFRWKQIAADLLKQIKS